MPSLPSRKSLEAMKRVDLQRICKDYGVRANLKSEALIDLLLDTQSTPAPPPQPAKRSVSTRTMSTSKAGTSRISSMIVHDIEEDEQDEDMSPQNLEASQPPPTPIVVPPVRTRKAKELQTKLGVGKPIIAGGQGARSVTRSSGSSRGRRDKVSRSVKPMETTIEEEPEDVGTVSKAVVSSSHEQQRVSITTGNSAEALDVRKLIDDATRSFQEQINALKSELSQVQSIKADLANLQVQIDDMRETQKDVIANVTSMKEDIKQLKDDLAIIQPPSTPKAQTAQGKHAPMPIGFGFPSTFKPPGPPTNNLNHAPSENLPSKNTLGKHARSLTEEESSERETSSKSSTTKEDDRPSKKAKLTTEDDTINQEERDTENEAGPSKRPVPTFTVYQGDEETLDFEDPPPPADHMSDFFEITSTPPEPTTNMAGTTKPSIPTSSANGTENQPHSFGFSYLPISSTPQNAMFMPSFPYPEPPQSPSPAGPSTGPFLGRHFEERTDIFKPLGLPSPLRSGRHYGSLQEDRGGFVNPAALSQTGVPGKQREISSNEVAAGLGLMAVRTTSSTDPGPTDAPAAKRTMYGTELESDTRFGDFGVEGVASGFWTTGRKF